MQKSVLVFVTLLSGMAAAIHWRSTSLIIKHNQFIKETELAELADVDPVLARATPVVPSAAAVEISQSTVEKDVVSPAVDVNEPIAEQIEVLSVQEQNDVDRVSAAILRNGRLWEEALNDIYKQIQLTSSEAEEIDRAHAEYTAFVFQARTPQTDATTQSAEVDLETGQAQLRSRMVAIIGQERFDYINAARKAFNEELRRNGEETTIVGN